MPSTPSSSSLIAEIVRVVSAGGVDLAALGLAWGRLAPTVTLVPAFGLRALPAPARGVLGLALAVAVAPLLVPLAAARHAEPWPLALLEEIVRGLPIALATAVPLWAATMTGGVVDALRASSDMVTVPVVESRTTPLGVPFSLLASAIFLARGGPARVALALATLDDHPKMGALGIVTASARDLVAGIALAVSLGSPLLVASVVIEIGAALVARSASPAQVHALLAPLRPLALLAVLGLVLDRLAALLAAALAG